MKSISKLSILALALLVPAVSIPLLVKASEVKTSTEINGHREGRGGMMSNRSFAKPMMNSGDLAKKEADMKLKKDAIDKALVSNDYAAWLTAVGKDSPIAKEVTSAEFPTFVEAHNLMKQAQDKLISIGVTHEGRGEGWGLGKIKGNKK